MAVWLFGAEGRVGGGGAGQPGDAAEADLRALDEAMDRLKTDLDR